MLESVSKLGSAFLADSYIYNLSWTYLTAAYSLPHDKLARRRAGKVLGRLADFIVGPVAQFIDTVTSVERASDGLVGLDKSLELTIQVAVLPIEHTAVVSEGLDLAGGIGVPGSQGLVGESEFLLLTTGDAQVVLSTAMLGLKIVQVCAEIAVASELTLRAAGQVSFLGKLGIESAAHLSLLFGKTSLVIAALVQVTSGTIVGFSGPAEVEIAGFGHLTQVGSFLLSLVERVVRGLDALASLAVLALLKGSEVAHPINLVLVTGLLFAQVGQLVRQIVYVGAQHVGAVVLLLAVPRRGKDLGLSPGDLLSCSCDFSLQVCVVTVLLIEEEAGVVNLFAQARKGAQVRLVTCFKVVVLEELLVVEVPVLGLNGVKLVAEGQVVLVPLLDLEYFGLKLRDEQILLVAGKMHRIVVLYTKKEFH